MNTILLLLGLTVSGNAPFCKVDNNGYQAYCYYYSLQSCQASLSYGYFCAMR